MIRLLSGCFVDAAPPGRSIDRCRRTVVVPALSRAMPCGSPRLVGNLTRSRKTSPGKWCSARSGPWCARSTGFAELRISKSAPSLEIDKYRLALRQARQHDR